MLNYDTLLSDQVKKMKPSGIRKFFDLAAMMEGVISLGVGEPDFQTPWTVRKAAVDSLERKRMVYTANSGMADLRKEICHYLNRNIGYSGRFGGDRSCDSCNRQSGR